MWFLRKTSYELDEIPSPFGWFHLVFLCLLVIILTISSLKEDYNLKKIQSNSKYFCKPDRIILMFLLFMFIVCILMFLDKIKQFLV